MNEMYDNNQNFLMVQPEEGVQATTGTGQPAMLYGEEPGFTPQPGFVPQQNMMNRPPRKKHKKRMSRRRRRYITAAAIMISVAAVLLVIAGVFLLSPKRKLMSAIKRTYSSDALSKGNYFEDYLGWQTLMTLMNQNGGSTVVDLSVTNLSQGDGKSLDVTLSDAVDKSAKVGTGSFKVGSSGSTVLDVDYYNDADYTYLDVNGVTDGYLRFANDNFCSEFNNSVLSDTFGSLQGYTPDRFVAAGNGKGGNDQVLEFVKGVWKGASVKSAGKETISIDGTEYKCKKYTVVLKQQVVNNALQKKQGGNGNDQLMESSSMTVLFPQLLNNLSANNTQSQMPGGQQGGQQQMPGGQQQVPSQGGQDSEMPSGQGQKMAVNSVSDDVVIDVYVDNGYVRALSASLMTDDTEITAKVANTGKDVVTSSMSIAVQMDGSQGSNTIAVDFEQRKQGSEIVLDAAVSTDGSRSLSADIYAVLDTASNSISGEGGFTLAGKDLDFDFDGKLTKVDAGKTISAEIDSMDVYSSGEKVLTADGIVAFSTEKNNAKEIATTEYYLDAFTADDSELSSYAGIDSGAMTSAIQNTLEALSVLRINTGSNGLAGDEDSYGEFGNQNPGSGYDNYGGFGNQMPGGGSGSYGFGGGSNGFGMGPGGGSFGFGGGSNGYGMGPGGGMMDPWSFFFSDDDSSSSGSDGYYYYFGDDDDDDSSDYDFSFDFGDDDDEDDDY